MGKNFIGPDELLTISKNFKFMLPVKNIPCINFTSKQLEKVKKDYVLVLSLPKDRFGKPMTINTMRNIFGTNPDKLEPCFYNQDWYLKEKFAKNEKLDFEWHLVKKYVDAKNRGKNPETTKEDFPSAVLLTFLFFAYYLCNHEILWKNDFIWCKDKDSNGDRIYVGRYIDSNKLNKNGFNIHRYLTIRPCYGFVSEIK
jgi:hypothetical protein